ncbi:Multidrug resistance protein EbrB [Sporotomaculum syntrophicum]|uniref:Multidrug resistance protein EbrB n=1 Tax=Sporotomaculum syntrophicum TaxID=182264 RepID=A0A9D3AYX4_9FIRM|nr:SMR family transporter [Sporotomaculum syntrophicum]KAF1085228.1 Multidrug resistance protein EbrB [Sporotomaculum syntrophicum]
MEEGQEFGLALKYLPLSTAYAVWAGMGTALTALVGIVLFHEDISILKNKAFLTIIADVVILNKSKEEEFQRTIQRSPTTLFAVNAYCRTGQQA